MNIRYLIYMIVVIISYTRMWCYDLKFYNLEHYLVAFYNENI